MGHLMKRVYYVVGSSNNRCLGTSGRGPELFSAVGYNKRFMEDKKRELEKEYPDYLFWVSWQFNCEGGINEIAKLRKHESMV